jgi:imidazolonepropionase-like amidohydrolase
MAKRMIGRIVIPVLAIFTFIAIPLAQNSHKPSHKLVLIKAQRLLDVRTGQYLSDQGVLVENERIKEVGDYRNLLKNAPKTAVVTDLGDLTLLPGLVDSHSHLFSAGDGRVDTTAEMNTDQRQLLAARNAREILEAGITTIRNLGGSGVRGDVVLRDRINAGQIIGPRIIAATRKLTPPGGQGNSLPQEVIERAFLPVSGEGAARQAVREAIKSGADVIKVVVDVGPRLLSLEEMKAIVDEANRHKLRVAAHAGSELAIATAIEAKVNSIEHGNGATEEMLRKMRERSIFLVLNLYTPSALRQIFAADLHRSPQDKVDFESDLKNTTEQSQRRLQRAMSSGVKIVAGSDMVYIYPGKTRGQASLIVLNALQEYGMPPIEIIRSATINAAELLGWQDSIGAIEANKYADLIAVKGDVLKGIRALETVAFVMKGGIIIRHEVRTK